MGLNFSHTEASWSYGGFMEFRKRLANQIGVNLDRMAGFGGKRSWTTVKDSIKLLLNHSDCDGTLSLGQCRKIAPRLRKLVSSWPNDDYDKVNALELADGMEKAEQEGVVLEFG